MKLKMGAIVAATMMVTSAACSKPESQQAAPAPAAAERPADTPAAAPAKRPPDATPPADAAKPSAAAPAPTSGSATPAPAAASGNVPPQPAATAPPAATPEPAPPPEPPKARTARLNSGRIITVRTTRELSTKTAKNGEVFSAILEQPIKVGTWVVAGEGARVDGRVVESDKGGRLKGRANLSVELTSITTADGQKIDVVTSPVSSEAGKKKGSDAVKIGAGAGIGAAVGGIAAGGTGAAVGALVGGGTGAAMRGEAAEIPAETVLSFQLRSPVTIHEKR